MQILWINGSSVLSFYDLLFIIFKKKITTKQNKTKTLLHEGYEKNSPSLVGEKKRKKKHPYFIFLSPPWKYLICKKEQKEHLHQGGYKWFVCLFTSFILFVYSYLFIYLFICLFIYLFIQLLFIYL